jgi:DNA-directed RNA polymerase specialized sigma24 family protein
MKQSSIDRLTSCGLAPLLTDQRTEFAFMLFRTGLTTAAVAERMGVSEASVANSLARRREQRRIYSQLWGKK